MIQVSAKCRKNCSRTVTQRGFAANTNDQTGQAVVFLGFCPWQGRRRKPIVCPTPSRRSASSGSCPSTDTDLPIWLDLLSIRCQSERKRCHPRRQSRQTAATDGDRRGRDTFQAAFSRNLNLPG